MELIVALVITIIVLFWWADHLKRDDTVEDDFDQQRLTSANH